MNKIEFNNSCVGTFALQIAKLNGAEVTCVDSKKKLDTLKSISADHVVICMANNQT